MMFLCRHEGDVITSGEYSKAIDLLNKAAEYSPKSASIQYYLAMAYYYSAIDSMKAVEHLKETLKLEPEHERAAKLLKKTRA